MSKPFKKDYLWKIACDLRGGVEVSEYKHIVLSLIFLKFASDKFDEHKKKIINTGNKECVNDNVVYIPEKSHWDYITQHAKQSDTASIIDNAFEDIEKENENLKGALPDKYFTRISLESSNLSSLIDTINNINTLQDKEQDIMGHIYEYFLNKFAIDQKKGEFYTPKSIVKLITEMIRPYQGLIYDPCCGSGGMFVQSIKFFEKHKGEETDISIYGQEREKTTYKLARMNLALRGIHCNLGEIATDTFHNDLHKDLKADYIIANPPFNLKNWREENALKDDIRWNGYDVPPKSNANYAWILHIVSKLSSDGVAGFLLSNGTLSGDGQEKNIRKQLIENKIVEAIITLPRKMFYATDIGVTLWILNKNKKARSVQNGNIKYNYRDRENEILFMDLRQIGEPFEKKFIQFSQDHIQDIAKTYHLWQQEISDTEYKNIPEYCYSANIEEVQANDYLLTPSRYIEFINRDENIDFTKKMTALHSELTELLQAEKQSEKKLLNVLKEIGYEIKL